MAAASGGADYSYLEYSTAGGGAGGGAAGAGASGPGGYVAQRAQQGKVKKIMSKILAKDSTRPVLQ
jgi:hypothetical protein